MKIQLPHAALAAALLLGSVSVDAISAPASAQGYVQVSFDAFHDRLAGAGDWVYSDRWGEVWIPRDVPMDFRPYDTAGHWVYTDEYGWYWASDFDWGDIPFHYGRWVNDPDDGWFWIPGYEWSPAWVAWRSNGPYTGWMAMPPDDAFLGVRGPGFGLSINFNDVHGYYGYSRWYGPRYGADRFAANWVFVPTGHIADRDFHRFAAPRGRYVTFIQSSRNITNYTVVNNYVVNRSVDVRMVERAGGRPIQAVRAAAVIRNPQFVLRVDTGRQIQMRVRQENPHGNGFANSAPQPSARVVQSLSTNVTVHNGGGQGSQHLFTRTTVQSAPLAGKPAGGGTMMGQPNGMQGGAGNGANDMGRHGNNGMMGGSTTTNGSTSITTNGSSSTTGGTTTGETHHHENGASTGAGPSTTTTTGGSMSGPGGGSTSGETHHHETGNGMTGPGTSTNGGSTSTTSGSSSTAGGAASTTGETSTSSQTHHHHESTNGAAGSGSSGGGSTGGAENGGMTGPNGSSSSSTTSGESGSAGSGTHHHHETGSMSGSGSSGGTGSSSPGTTGGEGSTGSQESGSGHHHETGSGSTASGAAGGASTSGGSTGSGSTSGGSSGGQASHHHEQSGSPASQGSPPANSPPSDKADKDKKDKHDESSPQQ